MPLRVNLEKQHTGERQIPNLNDMDIIDPKAEDHVSDRVKVLLQKISECEDAEQGKLLQNELKDIKKTCSAYEFAQAKLALKQLAKKLTS